MEDITDYITRVPLMASADEAMEDTLRRMTSTINSREMWLPTPQQKQRARSVELQMSIKFSRARLVYPVDPPARFRMSLGTYTASVVANVTWEQFDITTRAPLGRTGTISNVRLFDMVVPPDAATRDEPGGFVIVAGRDLALLPHASHPASSVLLLHDKINHTTYAIARYVSRGPDFSVAAFSVWVSRDGGVSLRIGLYTFIQSQLHDKRPARSADAPKLPPRTYDMFLLMAALGCPDEAALRSEFLRGSTDRALCRAFIVAAHMSTEKPQTQDTALAAIASSFNVPVSVVRHYMEVVFLPALPDLVSKRALVLHVWRTRITAPFDTDRDHLRINRFTTPGSITDDVFNCCFVGAPSSQQSFVALLGGQVFSQLVQDARLRGAPTETVSERLGEILGRVGEKVTKRIDLMYRQKRLPNVLTRSGTNDKFLSPVCIAPMESLNRTAAVAQQRTAVLDDAEFDVSRHMGHGSRLGFMDPSEGPEGAATGTRPGFSRGTRLSLPQDPRAVRAAICGLRDDDGDAFLDTIQRYLSHGTAREGWMVTVGGEPTGITTRPYELYAAFRAARVSGETAALKDVTMRTDTPSREVVVYCDAGRPMRGLVPVEVLLTRAPTFADIEFLDASEISTMAIIAARREDIGLSTTHVEAHPALIKGMRVLMSPLLPHCPPLRLQLSAVQVVQVISASDPHARYRLSNGTVGLVLTLFTPQHPLCPTRALGPVYCSEVDKKETSLGPSAVNCLVAIMSCSINTEDAVLVNEAAFGGGGGIGEKEKARFYQCVIRASSKLDRDLRVDETSDIINNDAGDTPWLKDGLPIIGAIIPPKGIVINRVARSVERIRPLPIRTSKFETSSRVVSVTIAPLDTGPPNAAATHGAGIGAWYRSGGVGAHVVFVLLASDAPLEPGDKITSRMGCKGVTAALVPSWQLPYVKATGCVPSIIFNPDTIGARKLTSQLLEMDLTTAVASRAPDPARLAGVLAEFPWLNAFVMPNGVRLPDMTPYSRPPEEDVAGIAAYCAAKGVRDLEVMVDPTTGEELEHPICCKMGSIEVLKHLVAGKFGAVGVQGPRNVLTRQPLRGRAVEGGGRLGDMECAAMIAAGAVSTLMACRATGNALFTKSVCGKCGRHAVTGPGCSTCGPGAPIVNSEGPFVHHLLTDQELPAAFIRVLETQA